MNKKQFTNQLQISCIEINHITERKLDYKYNEYLLFKILKKYDYEAFRVLGLPNDLEIKMFPDEGDYNINARTHVTLNYQLYKLYECGYFKNENELVEATLEAISRYNAGAATIKELDNSLRKLRMEYIKKMNNILYY